MALVQRHQFAAGVTLFLIGIVLVGLGLPGGTQDVVAFTVGLSVAIVGAVLAVFGYSERTR